MTGAATDLLEPSSLPTIASSPETLARSALATKIGSLSESQVAAARANWLKQFPDGAAQFDAAIAGTAPAEAKSADAPTPFVSATKQRTLTSAQIQSAVATLRAAGVSEEKIAEALAADEITLGDEKSPEQAARDAAFDLEHAPSDYRVNYMPHGGREIPLDQLSAFNAAATSWLAAIGLEPSLGAAVIEQAMAVGKSLAAMPESERALWKTSQRLEAARQLGGADKLDAAVARAALAIRRAGPSKMTSALLASGALNQAWLLVTLANHGARLEAYAKR